VLQEEAVDVEVARVREDDGAALRERAQAALRPGRGVGVREGPAHPPYPLNPGAARRCRRRVDEAGQRFVGWRLPVDPEVSAVERVAEAGGAVVSLVADRRADAEHVDRLRVVAVQCQAPEEALALVFRHLPVGVLRAEPGGAEALGDALAVRDRRAARHRLQAPGVPHPLDDDVSRQLRRGCAHPAVLTVFTAPQPTNPLDEGPVVDLRVHEFIAPGGRALIWSDNRTFAPNPPVCGPWLCLPASDATYDDELTAGLAATEGFLGTRIGDATFYGGLALGGLSTVYGPTAGDAYSKPRSPALYRSNYPRSGDSYAADVRSIAALWQGGAQPTLAQYQTLLALSLVYSGIQTRVPPYLIDWVVPAL
jgi:hypothetical protein